MSDDEDEEKAGLADFEEGWMLLELKHVLWAHANFSLLLKTDMSVSYVTQQIFERYGRVQEVVLYVGEVPGEQFRLKDGRQKLGQLFQTTGSKKREKPEKHALLYDFQPYNPTEPVLLAL